MSESDDGPGRREVAYRLFATEFDDADFEFSESDEERAPNYVITPTGGRVNRLFVVGVLTEVEPVSDDVLRGRVVDPTGGFVLYAGQYQPDERAMLDRTDPPAFVAVTGKARTFQPEDSSRVFTSVRPESISVVDADTRDRWTVHAAEQTLHRVEAMATGIALEATGDRLREALVERGYDEGLAAGVGLALDHYGTTPTYLAAVRDIALDAARHVAGDLDEVPELTAEPDEPGDVTATDLLDDPVEPLDPDGESTGPTAPDTADDESPTEPKSAGSDDPSTATTATSDAETGPADDASPAEPEAEVAAEVESASDDGPSEPARGESPADAGTNELDDQPATATSETDTASTDVEPSDGPGDFEPGEYDLDDEEREEVEAEYGTEFQTAADVDDPGEAGIETPDPEVEAEAEEEATPAEDSATEAENGADLVDAVVSAMGDLDEGDGASRSAVVDAVVEQTGVDADAVEDAIQEALMDGRCYEPDDATLMPI